MTIFRHNNSLFEQAKWETLMESNGAIKAKAATEGLEAAANDSNQFILLQLTGESKRVLNTTEVVPVLKGDGDKPDINMALDFESFKIGSNENIDPDTKVTL